MGLIPLFEQRGYWDIGGKVETVGLFEQLNCANVTLVFIIRSIDPESGGKGRLRSLSKETRVLRGV